MSRHVPSLVAALVAAALVGSGCASPLASGNDRIGRCARIMMERYPRKYSEDQIQKVCATWEGQGRLKDDGTYDPPSA